MIFNINTIQPLFKGKSDIKQTQNTFDSGKYLELLFHHDLIEIAFDSEDKSNKEPIAIIINQKGKLPITIWRTTENKGSFYITDYNYRNAARILIKKEDKNYSRIVGLVEHHVKNYKRNHLEKQTQKHDKESFTSALRSQALMRLKG
jgi:hypothetical protein